VSVTTTTTTKLGQPRPALPQWTLPAVIWVVLLSAPLWLGMVGGYTALAAHVVVMALVAMALNFLLGFTGVMSFGHAAYFGLGAYGCSAASPARCSAS
jgi:branched-chain amino acid transport system permease protein